jgi:hypothetical protein
MSVITICSVYADALNRQATRRRQLADYQQTRCRKHVTRLFRHFFDQFSLDQLEALAVHYARRAKDIALLASPTLARRINGLVFR